MTGLCDGKPNCSDGSDEDQGPAQIFIKTIAYKKSVGNDYAAMTRLFTKTSSSKGYCAKHVSSVGAMSNRRLCGGKTNRNIGWWYKVTFSANEGDVYSFKLPVDFGFGGVSVLDGKFMKVERKDIWGKGRASNLNFEARMTAGMHTLEVYGAETCCDGTN